MRDYLKAVGWLMVLIFVVPGLLLLLWAALPARGPTYDFVLWYGGFLLVEFVAATLIVAVLAVWRLPSLARALIAALVVYAVSLVMPIASPLARYPLHVVRCGGAPVVATDFASARSYRTPDSSAYAVTPLDSTFFCTPEAADHAGYRRSNL
ncbi:hypothetical protein [Planotetraspora kaengkrachanensis]|uniref:Uncharacterized protein n=1 Tax=Planotetraspora kaengkrachanensis TaxID=575193 RepID=A0A8J3M592_9ACTN|nr:hypothetical protein [Planotetraspora kaengkrachanensis]GIG77340.1 hypothetical protein Pka01_04670 [Planotetraspora kaengkrachanensis]